MVVSMVSKMSWIGECGMVIGLWQDDGYEFGCATTPFLLLPLCFFPIYFFFPFFASFGFLKKLTLNLPSPSSLQLPLYFSSPISFLSSPPQNLLTHRYPLHSCFSHSPSSHPFFCSPHSSVRYSKYLIMSVEASGPPWIDVIPCSPLALGETGPHSKTCCHQSAPKIINKKKLDQKNEGLHIFSNLHLF